jgi:hypothetical protein
MKVLVAHHLAHVQTRPRIAPELLQRGEELFAGAEI